MIATIGESCKLMQPLVKRMASGVMRRGSERGVKGAEVLPLRNKGVRWGGVGGLGIYTQSLE